MVHGKVVRVVMIPGKSYCFIEYANIEDAECAFYRMHGQSQLGQNGVVLYLSYVDLIPDYKNPWSEGLPKGLILIDDFISEDEETMLIESLTWDNDGNEGSSLKHRQVTHYGYEFLYGTNNVDSRNPMGRKIPENYNYVFDRIKRTVPGLGWYVPEQMTANKYLPGQGIPPHVDTHSAFHDPIISLSLLGDIVMEFKKGDIHACVHLKRRSILIMTQECRYAWTHGITPRMTDIILHKDDGLTVVKRQTRISLTFRKLKSTPCECIYHNLCDSFAQKANSIVENAAKLELENVHNVYNQIGNHFSETRHSPWPNVEEFILSLHPGSILCDIGCGNGKYLKSNPQIYNIGCDRSESLLSVCREREFNVFLSDCLNLPFASNTVDACISIAVIHHLASKERRIKAIQEMTRILATNGKALIYVWAKNQKANNKKSSYLRQNKKTDENGDAVNVSNNIEIESKSSLPIHTNRTQFKHQDILVPWKLKNEFNEDSRDEKKTFLRFYHVFEENELENLCREIKNIEIVKSYYDQGNWCIIFKKI